MDETVRADARVCPDCGQVAVGQPFCSRCGRNLTQDERLPSRSDWERDHPEEVLRSAVQASARKRRLRIASLVAGTVVLIIVVAVGLVLATRKDLTHYRIQAASMS